MELRVRDGANCVLLNLRVQEGKVWESGGNEEKEESGRGETVQFLRFACSKAYADFHVVGVAEPFCTDAETLWGQRAGRGANTMTKI